MTIEQGKQFKDPGVWKISILDSHGDQMYKDEDSDFIASLNVYWIWDNNDRMWLYNSDNGAVWFWELQNDKWVKRQWGYAKTKEIDRDLTPPAEVYPDYAK